ncbi:MAG: GMC oxidoreductase, partial [Burkholderiaceae bacterium]|nr:GMC oxidoreductase [Burkholderiaceae bacterium]
MIDRGESVAEGQQLNADVCVVGAGPVGIGLTLALAGSGLQVLLLEGGQETPDPAAQDLYEGEVADEALHCPPVRYRMRQFGGATTTWGGRCVPLDPHDFESRPAMPGSGWPIRHQDLTRFYPAANALCEAGDFEYTAARAFAPGTPPMFGIAPGPRVTVEGLERFSCPTDFGRRYKERLRRAAGVQVLIGANCTHIGLNPDGGAVRVLQVATLSGRRFTVAARTVVLAVGGLETARLLLASNDVHRLGVGNLHDVVGRYYMCHLAGSVGSLVLPGPPAAVRHGYERSPEGVYCRRRIALTPAAQSALGVGNMVARMHFPAVADPSHHSSVLSGIFLTRRLLSYEYSRRVANPGEGGRWAHLRHIGNIVRYPHDAAGFLAHWFLQRTVATRKFPSVILKNRNNRFSLELNAEQRALADSRVTLIDARDALGVPRLRVDWRYADSDIESARRTLQAIADEFAATGAGTLTFDAASLRADLTRYGAYGGHHIGTTRMGNDPTTSVVDANARVHGIGNLYVAGSAVFPSSSQANPTLAAIALALRLAEHLAQSL